jgi:hypothetical protein
MSEGKQILRHMFRGIVKDTSPITNKDRCSLQFSLLQEYRDIKDDEAMLNGWAEELMEKYPQYFKGFVLANSNKSYEDDNDDEDDENNNNFEENELNFESETNESNTETINVVRRQTLTTGDCFYSSIFRGSVEQGILDQLMKCLKLSGKTELEFIQSFRYMLAKRVLADKLPKEYDERLKKEQDLYEVLYDTLHETIPGMKEEKTGTRAKNIKPQEQTIGTYRLVLSSSPEWFRTAFWNGLPSREDFRNIVAEEVKKMKNWVGTIEVEMTAYLLKKVCKITLVRHNSSPKKDLKSKDDGGQPILHLRNLGEAHWEYYSFDLKKMITFPSNGSYPILTSEVKKGGKRRVTRKKRRGLVFAN